MEATRNAAQDVLIVAISSLRFGLGDKQNALPAPQLPWGFPGIPLPGSV